VEKGGGEKDFLCKSRRASPGPGGWAGRSRERGEKKGARGVDCCCWGGGKTQCRVTLALARKEKTVSKLLAKRGKAPEARIQAVQEGDVVGEAPQLPSRTKGRGGGGQGRVNYSDQRGGGTFFRFGRRKEGESG